MAYKRQIGRLPIIPADAKVQTVVCHYCIVGCGYKAYSWDARYEGGTAPADNAFGVDLSKQQPAETAAWYAPSMYNLVKQDGKDVHLVIKPDKDCVVNSGLGSVRGARIAEMSYSRQRNTQLQRLTDPLVWRYGQLQPTSWDDALDLVARVTAAVIAEQGEDGLIVSAFDHGGAGGGYENTWGTGKLYFQAMKIKNIRIHNRPAYNSELHGSRDMGVGELNNAYEDAELADTIVAVGTNALETQTNYFLNHWVPNLRGSSADKKKAEFGAEPTDRARVVIVDPRRTVTVNACEVEAGKENVLHLAINSGTDLILFNAWFTYAAEKGWVDRPFIEASTTSFDVAVAANKVTVAEAAAATGLSKDDIVKAITWIAEPATGFEDGKIVGTKRLFADGKFNKPDGNATFAEMQWRGLQAPGKQAEKDKFAFLINNGRANLVWQSAYLDVENELVMDRWPYPFIEMNPDDMVELGLGEGDLVEVYNDNGSTQAMAYPTPTAKRKQAFMLFAYPSGVQGNVVSAGVNEFVIPNYKQTWGDIRKIADAPEGVRHITFKSKEYTA
jgi:anaerobic selenocysteine-containing dehydrogenase